MHIVLIFRRVIPLGKVTPFEEEGTHCSWPSTKTRMMFQLQVYCSLFACLGYQRFFFYLLAVKGTSIYLFGTILFLCM